MPLVRRSPSASGGAGKQGFAPPAQQASFKDLLLFEERLKQNAALLRSRKRKYEGASSRVLQTSFGIVGRKLTAFPMLPSPATPAANALGTTTTTTDPSAAVLMPPVDSTVFLVILSAIIIVLAHKAFLQPSPVGCCIPDACCRAPAS